MERGCLCVVVALIVVVGDLQRTDGIPSNIIHLTYIPHQHVCLSFTIRISNHLSGIKGLSTKSFCTTTV